MGFPCVQITEDATFITNEMYVGGECYSFSNLSILLRKNAKKTPEVFYE